MFSERVHFSETEAAPVHDLASAPGPVPPPHRARRDARRDRTEAAILDAARELFSSKGFTATTVRGIAAQAGVSVGRVMAVGDKERLLVLTVEAEVQRIHERRIHEHSSHEQRPPREPGGGGSAAGEIGALIRPFVSFFTADPELAREYGAVLMRGRTRAAIFDGLSERLEAEIEALLRAHAAARPATPDAHRLRAAARTVYLAYLGALFAAAHGALPFERIETEVASAVDAVTAASDRTTLEGERCSHS
jgi:AcrR family transcriptional regulator